MEIRDVISNAGQIIEGHARELLGLNKELSEERLKICYKCPIYSSFLGGVCNDKLYLNPNTGDISTEERDGYIEGCGCRLPAKTTLIEEECPAGKW